MRHVHWPAAQGLLLQILRLEEPLPDPQKAFIHQTSGGAGETASRRILMNTSRITKQASQTPPLARVVNSFVCVYSYNTSFFFFFFCNLWPYFYFRCRINCEWPQRINILSMFGGIPLLFFKLFSSRLSSIGRQIPSADKQSDATGDGVWASQAGGAICQRKISGQFLQGTESNMWLSNLHVYPIGKKQKTKCFDFCIWSHAAFRDIAAPYLGSSGRRSFTSFKRQKSELWLVSPVSRCQEIPRWIPLSHSRNYTVISPRMTGQVKLSKAFRLQLDHLWCMFLPPCLFKLTLAAYYTTAHSL